MEMAKVRLRKVGLRISVPSERTVAHICYQEVTDWMCSADHCRTCSIAGRPASGGAGSRFRQGEQQFESGLRAGVGGQDLWDLRGDAARISS
jgi:hypothetical protein